MTSSLRHQDSILANVPEDPGKQVAPEGRKTVATGESPWISPKDAKPRRDDRGSRGEAFCRPCGPAGLIHWIGYNPGLASRARFCRPSGTSASRAFAPTRRLA